MRLPRSTWFTRAVACGAAGACLALSAPGIANAQQDPDSCPPSVGLTNSSFEEPDVRGPWLGPESHVPGWHTTARDSVIEIWGPGNSFANNGTEAPAASGDQFAELNATQASTLYQDVATKPGQKLRWRLSHRARDFSRGVDRDTMNVLIGTPGKLVPQNPAGASEPDIVDDDSTWGQWSGYYTVPAGQTTTRFGFKAIRTGSGIPSYGNFLDGIEFGTPACLITTKSAKQSGNQVTYTVKVTNSGGAAAVNAVVTDPIPDGAEYVPGSLTLDGKPVTDKARDDAGEVSTSDAMVRLPSPFEAGDTATISFRMRATGEKSPLVNTAAVGYKDGLTSDKGTSVSNTTRNAVELTASPTPGTPAAQGDAQPPLADTGASVGLAIVAAVALLGLGAGLTLYARRRRT